MQWLMQSCDGIMWPWHYPYNIIKRCKTINHKRFIRLKQEKIFSLKHNKVTKLWYNFLKKFVINIWVKNLAYKQKYNIVVM